jgi:hypothetical protein
MLKERKYKKNEREFRRNRERRKEIYKHFHARILILAANLSIPLK